MHTRLMTVLAATLLSAASVNAQQLRFINGQGVGGVIDAYGRVVAEHMARTLGKTYVVETRLGNSGNLAVQYVAAQPADGSTILLGTLALIEINPNIFENLRWSPKDFLPLIRGVDTPLVFVAHASVPATTLAQFIDWAKSKSGTLSYASYNAGTTSHFLGEQLNEKFKLNLTHVPYRGTAPQIVDLMAGHVQFGFTTPQSAVPLVETGQLRALASTGEQRLPLLRDTPTFAELGYPEFNASNWIGMLVRRDTPASITEALLQAAVAAHADPKVRETFESQGYVVSAQTGPAFAQSLADGTAKWGRIVRATGFKATE